MFQSLNGALKTINSSRLTVDVEGYLHFSNVTRKDNSDDFLYACSAASYFRNEYKLGNKVHLQVIQSGSSAGLQNKHEPVRQYVTRKNHIAYRGKEVKMWCIFGGTPLPEIRYCVMRLQPNIVNRGFDPCFDVIFYSRGLYLVLET